MWWKLARLGVLFPNYMFIKFTYGLFWKENILQISCHNLNCIAFYFSYFKIILCLLWSNCPIQCNIHKYGNPVVLSMGLSDWSMTFKVNFEVNFQGECSSSQSESTIASKQGVPTLFYSSLNLAVQFKIKH